MGIIVIVDNLRRDYNDAHCKYCKKNRFLYIYNMYSNQFKYKKIAVIFGVFFVSLIFNFGFGINSVHAAASLKGLVGYWSMDSGDINGSTIYDKSGNRNNGTIFSTTSTPGKIKQAQDFNGSPSSQITVAQSPSINTFAAVTISVWMKTRTPAASQIFVRKASGGVTDLIQLDNYGSNFRWLAAANSSGVKTVTSASTVKANTWYHVVGVYDGTNVILYINGKQDGTPVGLTGTISTATDSSLYFSSLLGGGNSWYTGLLDDIRIYNRALSAAEVATIYNDIPHINPIPAPNKGSNLVGYWTMDSGDYNGTTMYDKSGNGNNATSTGTSNAVGKIKQARSFNGSSDYMSAANISIPGSITVGAWVYTNNNAGNMFIVQKEPVNTQWELFYEGGKLKWRGDSQNDYPGTTCTAPSNGAWHNVMATESGTQVAIYIDGVKCNGGTGDAIGNASRNIDIGKHDLNGYYFTGQIDDVRIYNRALSAGEVKQLYNSARSYEVYSDPLKGLEGFWTMDNRDIATSTTVFNKAGSGNDVYTVGGPAVVPGQIGQAFNLNTTSKRLQNTTTTIGNYTNGTITAWINPSIITGGSSCNSHNGSGACRSISWNDDHGWFFGVNTDGALFIDLGNGSSWLVVDNTVAGLVVTNKWQFVAVTVSGTTVKYYVNGVMKQKNTVAANSGLAMGSNSRLGIGGSALGSNFNFLGLMDEQRIYSRALSDADIAQLYRASAKSIFK